MNVANFTANVSYGLTDRLDCFAAWDFITRVDRDNQLLFNPIRTAAASIPGARSRTNAGPATRSATSASAPSTAS
jgi:hypothetical protein